jgi:hypothetical protein
VAIPACFPGRDLTGHGGLIGKPSVQTLTR